MERAELKCRKLKMGMVPYFIGLVMKSTSMVFWEVITRRETRAYVSIWRMAQTTEYHGNISKGDLSIETIDQKVIKAER